MSPYDFFDPSLFAIASVFDACGGILVGLLFVVIGFVTVRSAHATAGYLVGGAGALSMFAACCGSWQAPAMTWLDLYEVTDAVGGLSSAVALLFYFGSVGLVIAGGAVLAKELTARKQTDAAPTGGL